MSRLFISYIYCPSLVQNLMIKMKLHINEILARGRILRQGTGKKLGSSKQELDNGVQEPSIRISPICQCNLSIYFLLGVNPICASSLTLSHTGWESGSGLIGVFWSTRVQGSEKGFFSYEIFFHTKNFFTQMFFLPE